MSYPVWQKVTLKHRSVPVCFVAGGKISVCPTYLDQVSMFSVRADSHTLGQ